MCAEGYEVIRCPVCEPLSYYGGKTGLDETESKDMCDFCFNDLLDLFKYMRGITGDPAFTSNKSPIIDNHYNKIMNAYLVASKLPYHVIKQPIDCKVEKILCFFA